MYKENLEMHMLFFVQQIYRRIQKFLTRTYEYIYTYTCISAIALKLA